MTIPILVGGERFLWLLNQFLKEKLGYCACSRLPRSPGLNISRATKHKRFNTPQQWREQQLPQSDLGWEAADFCGFDQDNKM